MQRLLAGLSEVPGSGSGGSAAGLLTESLLSSEAPLYLKQKDLEKRTSSEGQGEAYVALQKRTRQRGPNPS